LAPVEHNSVFEPTPVPLPRAAPGLLVGTLPRILMPDLAAVLAVAALVYCWFVFGGGELFRDSDSGWHIITGERILLGRSLPRVDPYSFSKSGQPWIDWEWGSDALIGWAHRLDGLRGVTALFGLAIAACTWLWCRLNFGAGGDFFLTALLAPPVITTVSLHWLARPHVFSWLFLLAAIGYAERSPARFSLRQFTLIAAATALWANLHASFFLAPAIALIYAVSHFIRPLIWQLDPAAERNRARWFLKAAAASAVGSLLNPYGWRLHAHVFSYLRNEELTRRVAEFQSFNFHDPDAAQIAFVMGVAAAGGILALTQRKLAHFLLAGAFFWGGLRSARVIPLVALLILPLANAAFAQALRGAQNLRPVLRQAIDSTLRYSARLRWIDMRLNGAAFAVFFFVLLMLALRAPSQQIGFSSKRFPVNAAATVEKLPAESRILTPDSFGGYLIYRFHGERKVYFDGRSDFYGVDFMKQYFVLINARAGWKEILHSFQFTHALLPSDGPLKGALEQAGWKTLYTDEVATLLEAHPDES
jgi:hypothetical protein